MTKERSVKLRDVAVATWDRLVGNEARRVAAQKKAQAAPTLVPPDGPRGVSGNRGESDFGRSSRSAGQAGTNRGA